MAELLVRAAPAHSSSARLLHPGQIVYAVEDGFNHGKNCYFNADNDYALYVLKVPGVPAEVFQKYLQEEMDPLELVHWNRRLFRIVWEDLPRSARRGVERDGFGVVTPAELRRALEHIHTGAREGV